MRARKFACTQPTWQSDGVTQERPDLRERKKRATQEALREAALRLALEHGTANVRVADIAEAAGVSPRTYNNYFSSREQAIVAAVTARREARIAEATAAQPAHIPLADAVTTAIVQVYTTPGDDDHPALLLIATDPALRHAFLDTTAGIEAPLTTAMARRLGHTDQDTARILAASVTAAVRIALERWLRPATGSAAGLVVPTGSLPDLLRDALAPLAPALDAAR
ncbi:TetR family transcriptional regulator [Actinoplanes cyaneus]|uniref:TetR family transcriptional regulator n=1 Tax=Actinoplanes cyaneus TaxID=52696 RepID=A0A919IP16_9ACTN|nr:TetR family transcriptional regulator [Actinoplanes cyaneus]